MSIGPRWKARLEADGERLALLLGLSDEEFAVAKSKPYFLTLAGALIKAGARWNDWESDFVKQGMIAEINGENVVYSNPTTWFED